VSHLARSFNASLRSFAGNEIRLTYAKRNDVLIVWRYQRTDEYPTANRLDTLKRCDYFHLLLSDKSMPILFGRTVSISDESPTFKRWNIRLLADPCH
jgi:hypothetical protein